MKHLVGVRLADGTMVPRYFHFKWQAKRERDQHPGACVVLGPDHWRYNK